MSDWEAWLKGELLSRGWSQRELARRAGLPQASVSKTLTGDRNPTADIAIKIARALDLSPILVLMIADILPPEIEQSEAQINDIPPIGELLSIARRLPPDQLRELIDYAYFKLSRR